MTISAFESPQASFIADDGVEIRYRHWPSSSLSARAAVLIVHGAAEHSGRYDAFANRLAAAGYAVYASDHRGHGHTRLRTGALGDAGPDAWNRFVTDEGRFGDIIRDAHPGGVPLVLFGHSLGSFIAQDAITRYPARVDALVLSGTAYDGPAPAPVLEQLDALAESAPLAASEAWAARFADYNRAFSSGPGFDWLSRDTAVVAAYEADPLCGFAFGNELVRDLTRGMAAMRNDQRETNIPTELPVLVIQGARDPVGGDLAGTRALLARYAELGLTRVRHHFYADARHEVLNETNREEVYADVLAWLDDVTP